MTAHRIAIVLFLSVIALSAAACGNTSPATSNRPDTAPPQTSGQPVAASEDERPTPTPTERLLIDAIVLAAGLDEDGAPTNEIVTVPGDARFIYFAILMRDVREGTEFEAEWLKDGETIGWTERRAGETIEGEQWIALRFAPLGGFDDAKYSVRLSINGAYIESLVFNTGGVASTRSFDSNPRLVFAQSWSADQSAVSARTSFEAGTQRVVAILTNVTDQSSPYVSYWHRDGQFVAEIRAGQVRMASVRTFTFESSSAMPEGNYSVSVYAGDQQVASSNFTVAAPDTAGADQSLIISLAVVPAVDAESHQGLALSVPEVSTPEDMQAMVLVGRLLESDTLEIIWHREGVAVWRSELSGESLSDSWVISEYALPAENEDIDYEVVVLLNDEEVRRHQFVARASSEP